MLAKAVAHESRATFIHMSGSELVHKFIGEGAQLVRDIFQMAREKAPASYSSMRSMLWEASGLMTVPREAPRSTGP